MSSNASIATASDSSSEAASFSPSQAIELAANESHAHAAPEAVDVMVGIAARDQIRFQAKSQPDGTITEFRLTGSGCPDFISMLSRVRGEMTEAFAKGQLKWAELPQTTGADHAAILFRELFLRAQGGWHPPFVEAELCHCRSIATARVDQAIVCGSHTIQQIARETSAGTSCGTCRSDSAALIKYRTGLTA